MVVDAMGELCGKAVGAVVNPAIEFVDVDGAVRQIDVDKLIERIDLDALLDRVDLNRHLERIDLNVLLSRVNVDDLVLRSDLAAIIGHSTTGIFTNFLDKIRSKLVVLDLLLLRLTRFIWKDREGVLPPGPGLNMSATLRYYPKANRDKAIAVQGRYCGFFSKAVAIFIDVTFVTLTFALLIILIQLCWILFVGKSHEDAKQKVASDSMWVFVLYCMYWSLHFFLGVLFTGTTLGMGVIGIKVVDSQTGNDEDVTFFQSLVRTAILPLSLTVMPFLGLIGVWRRDGRMLHDIVAGTGMIYDWDAMMAKMRKQSNDRLGQKQHRQSMIMSPRSETSTSRNTPLLSPDNEDSDEVLNMPYSTFDPQQEST